MAVSFGVLGAFNSGTGTTASATAPASTNGKVLICGVRHAGTSNPTAPTGWTIAGQGNWFFGSARITTYKRVGDGTATDDFSCTVTNALWEAVIVRLEDGDTTTPVNDFTNTATGDDGGATFDVPAEGVANDGSMSVMFGGSTFSSGQVVSSAPAGYTVRGQTSQRSFFCATAPCDTGTFGSGTWTMNGGIRYGGALVIVNPGAGAPYEFLPLHQPPFNPLLLR